MVRSSDSFNFFLSNKICKLKVFLQIYCGLFSFLTIASTVFSHNFNSFSSFSIEKENHWAVDKTFFLGNSSWAITREEHVKFLFLWTMCSEINELKESFFSLGRMVI